MLRKPCKLPIEDSSTCHRIFPSLLLNDLRACLTLSIFQTPSPAMLCLLLLPVLLLSAQAASPGRGCTVAPCFHPPCPSFCPPPSKCRVVPCWHPPCPELCDTTHASPPCGCACTLCLVGTQCVENPFTGKAKCVPIDLYRPGATG